MSDVKNIPRLRFPGFDDHWRTERLGRISKFQNGVGHEQSIDSEGNIIVVNSKFISTEGEVKKYTQEVLSEIQDDSFSMVMSDVPNGKAIAKCYYFTEGRSYSLNQRICSIKSKTENNKFLFYQINRNKYYLKFDNGVGQTNLRKSEVLNCPVIFPSLPEQQKIADFLTAVDKRIELLEKKKTLLETYKKGVMKKIFNQEIRFKDDNGNDFPDWDKKRLGELSPKMKSGGTPKSTIKDYYDGDIPFLSIGDMTSQNKYLNWTSKTISKRGLENSSSWVVPKNSIIYSMYASVGFVSINKIDLSISQAVMAIQPIDEMNLEFLYYSLLNFQPKIKSLIETGTQGNINGGIVKNIPIETPSLNEQIKISEFLSYIDNQIELLDTQIDKSKTWKKGLLQKMFV